MYAEKILNLNYDVFPIQDTFFFAFIFFGFDSEKRHDMNQTFSNGSHLTFCVRRFFF